MEAAQVRIGIGAAPPSRDDTVGGHRGQQRADRVAGENRGRLHDHVHRAGVGPQQRIAVLAPARPRRHVPRFDPAGILGRELMQGVAGARLVPDIECADHHARGRVGEQRGHAFAQVLRPALDQQGHGGQPRRAGRAGGRDRAGRGQHGVAGLRIGRRGRGEHESVGAVGDVPAQLRDLGPQRVGGGEVPGRARLRAPGRQVRYLGRGVIHDGWGQRSRTTARALVSTLVPADLAVSAMTTRWPSSLSSTWPLTSMAAP